MAPVKKKAKKIDLNDEKKRLVGIWSLVTGELLSKVKGGDDASIQFLSKSFPLEKYPAKNSTAAHCVFCHSSFDPRLPKPCRKDHEWDEGDRYQKWPPRWSYTCLRCEESADVEDDDCPGGDCRNGVCSDDIKTRINENWLTDDTDEVDETERFDGCSICAGKACDRGKAKKVKRKVKKTK
mmetsp:Transcript_15537/g.20222  ORF Transcript_15537/g.20222 Transcript_15537/m.20222 type:complete len:181 (-) Transcript_15537:53-595(-)|eukprot:CAMPEP_0198147982 /NCGR_PEP_ID=MMETSP1443-20131203/38952_1 /TAXON_ID=186043 /ORGANISM="Entomoneis sp., Strain CCMP2396" /LENGTH=180 /DNA_ID=CAMNT_0043812529 /DNA_START=46 /DNA_END=588 /DNA_ORIENTATION=+